MKVSLVSIRGADLKVGDIVENWEAAEVLDFSIDPPPNTLVCANTTKGPFACGVRAQLTVFREVLPRRSSNE